MSEDAIDEPATIHDYAERGREKLEEARSRAGDGLAVATDYIRANPWIAVAGAAVIGGVIGALSASSKPQPRTLDGLREWIDEAYAKLPSQKQVQSFAESSGVPDFLKGLKRKLNRH